MHIHNRLSIKAGIFPQVFIVQKKMGFFFQNPTSCWLEAQSQEDPCIHPNAPIYPPNLSLLWS